MRYTKEFEVKDFPWKPASVHVIMKARNAGKIKELEAEIVSDLNSYTHISSEGEIDEWVRSHADDLLRRIGLTPKGEPLPTKKPIKVFLRLTTIVEQEVDADTPEEAKECAEELFYEESDPLIRIDRDDIESLVPVAYDTGDGDTKNYEE